MSTQLDSTYGAALVGLVVGAILYGITLLQTYEYFKRYPHDTTFVKSLVLLLWLLDTLHVYLCTRTIYWYLVTNFSNFDNLDDITWSMALQTDCNGLIGLIVEWYFARRVWYMSQNWLITGVIVVLACLHFSLGVVFTVFSFTLGHFSRFGTLTWVTCVGLGAAAAADVLIAAAMCWSLYKKRTGIARTDSVVTTLMIYSINTGLLTSILALVSVITFATMPVNFVWLSFFWIMGKCYVNSFLALLNSRENLREKASRVAVGMSRLRTGRSVPSMQARGSGLTRKPSEALAVTIETVTEYREDYPDTPYNSHTQDDWSVDRSSLSGADFSVSVPISSGEQGVC
ncbi:hypothetical protein CERSUDRAFT_81422 [Gelatoporia subvermispora B]|uniref:DUF6534 domain-containing protein n=1 Tax=Ceriporiopsis subvermispora (strain B) TaxID=914234 RepID=M2QSW1_CERS8|nr:hypothetical protein CERSUDRAFT_81422 [Gelatoporia subvermispora B]